MTNPTAGRARRPLLRAHPLIARGLVALALFAPSVARSATAPAAPRLDIHFGIPGVPTLEDIVRSALPQPPLAAAVPPATLGRPEPARGSRAARIEGRLERNQTLASALRRVGLGDSKIFEIAREMRGVLDLRRARPGDRFVLRLDAAGEVQAFEYTTVGHDRYVVTRQGDRFVTQREGGDYIRRTARIAGVVRSNLYDAVEALGEQPSLARDFADVFQYDVDFARGIRPGDEFQILYERLFRVDAKGQEKYLRPGRIHAAQFKGASGTHTAVYYESSETRRGGYYRPDGSAMEKSFLIAPLRYERVTSGYSHARFHPILRYTRPHLGIDYAAPAGTPLWAVGDGKVIFAGRQSGFGNLVKIEHAGGYVSYYSHLSRLAPGLRVGQMVRQKQVIAFVGSTGLATGPHVCFRISKDGQYVNPAKLQGSALFTASVGGRRDFREARDTLLAGLRSRDLVPIEDAL